MPKRAISSPTPGTGKAGSFAVWLGVAYDPIRAAYASHIGEVLGVLGMPVVVNRTSFIEIVITAFDTVDWDMYMLGWGLSTYPDYLTAFFRTGELFNTPGYSNPAYDALSAEFDACTEIGECREVAFEMQEILATDLPYVTLFIPVVVEAYRADKISYPFTNSLDGLQRESGMPELVQVFDD